MTESDFQKTYMAGLNPQQCRAVQAVDGQVLLLAVPGSGKTTVLVTRLGYMVHCRAIPPENILAITYTVAATEEMRSRFGARFGMDAAGKMSFRTINGLCAKIIEYYGTQTGRGWFQIAPEQTLTAIITDIYIHLCEDYPTEAAIRDLKRALSFVKNSMRSDEEIGKIDAGIDDFPAFYQQYQAALKAQRLMDYDDQLVYALRILELYPQILEYFQDLHRFICLDEAQDTSKIQHKILNLLSSKYGNLFMVGDEDQSIYGFRAAYPAALMDFRRTYPGGELLFMEENYRSTVDIVTAARGFVEASRERYKKTFLPARDAAEPLHLIHCKFREEQYLYLLEISREIPEDTAILFRNNESILPLIDRLERQGIPYIYRKKDITFFTHPILRDIIAFYRLAENPKDAGAFLEIYYKLGIGITKSAAQFACEKAVEKDIPLLEALLFSQEIRDTTRAAAMELQGHFDSLLRKNALGALSTILHQLHYRQFMELRKWNMGKMDILEMIGQNLPSLGALLTRLDQLKDRIAAREDGQQGIILSTVHTSKGQEYDRVFLLDVFDTVLPSKAPQDVHTTDDYRDYEEERRIFYVAMTRAKNSLYLFQVDAQASCFLKEIQEKLPRTYLHPEELFAPFRASLLGKTFADREKGEGRVIAQCEDDLLIQWGREDAALLSISQLLSRRDSELMKREPPETQGSAGSLKFQVGMTVHHKVLGKAKILDLREDTITLRFADNGAERMFGLQFCLKDGLLEIVT